MGQESVGQIREQSDKLIRKKVFHSNLIGQFIKKFQELLISILDFRF